MLGSLGYKEKLIAVDSAIQMNAEFLHDIAKDPGLFDEKAEPADGTDGFPESHASRMRLSGLACFAELI